MGSGDAEGAVACWAEVRLAQRKKAMAWDRIRILIEFNPAPVAQRTKHFIRTIVYQKSDMRPVIRVICALGLAIAGWGQTAGPSFEVATIKPSKPSAVPIEGRVTGQMMRSPGRVSYDQV